MNAAKILLPLVLLAAAGGGLWFLLHQPDAPPPVATGPEQPAQPQQPAPQPPPEPQTARAEAPPPTMQRTAVDLGRDRAEADAEQGVEGRVLLPNGAPAPGVPVYLMKNFASDPIQAYLLNRSGQSVEPVAQMLTGSDGSFRLGVRSPRDSYDVRVVPDDYPELDWRGVKIREFEYVAVPDLQLQPGVLVQGRVTEEGTGAAVRDATVYLNATNQMHQMLATPGREKGIAVQVDASGSYRCDCAPREGSIVLAAEAPGYARVEKPNLMLQPDQVNQFDLELPRGLPIAGVVQDQHGKPIANAKVEAMAISNKVPQTGRATSDGDGRFVIAALREGPYQLQASAAMFGDKVEKPVLAGEEQVVLVLEQQGAAKVRVLDRQGRPVKAFTLSLKRSFPGSAVGIGNVQEFHDQRIVPPDFQGEFATIRGIPNGDFVFQITAANHARTLSAPFHVQAGGEVPEVTVELTLGGVLLGRVIDDRGNPVAGAKVSTDINSGFAADTEFFQIFQHFMPETITKTSGTTDRQGRFRLPLLAFGTYMLRAAHPDFCEGVAMELKIETENDVQVGDIVLNRGALVEGVTTVGGQPQGQVRVTIGPPPTQNPVAADAPGTGNERPKMMFMTYAISDSDGHYKLLKRVPPGTYVINASREAGANNPFVKLLQMKQTERQLVVPPGQDRIVQNFDVPAQ